MESGKAPRVVEGSCWTCRKRRVKCSLDRPSCARCLANGTDCEYGTKLHWVGGPTVRGRRASGPASLQHETPNQLTRASSAVPPVPSFPELDCNALVSYFCNAVIPRFQLGPSGSSIDEGSLVDDPALRSAVLAISKAHFHLNSRSSLNAQGAHDTGQYRQLALGDFRKRVESGVSGLPSAQELLQVVTLFCILDGVVFPETESNASIAHLKGGCSLLDRWSSVTSSMVVRGGLQAHLASIFVTMDLIHAILAGERPYFDPTAWLMFGEVDAWWGRLECGDRFLFVLKGFSETALLGHLVKSHLPGDEGTRIAGKCLPSVEMMLNAASGLKTSPSFASACDWDAFCSTYEIAAAIYVQRAIRNRPIWDETVQSLARKGVSYLLVDSGLPGMLAHCVIFPLLVIGSHCIDAKDRKTALESLSQSTSYLSFGNLLVMRNFIKQVWTQSKLDCTWWEMFEPVSSKTFLF